MHLHLHHFVFLAFILSSVQGAHSFSDNHHARRSFSIVKRQSGLFGNLGNSLDGILSGNGPLGDKNPADNGPDGNTPSASSPSDTSATAPPPSSPVTSSPPSDPPASSPPPPKNTGLLGNLGNGVDGVTSGLGGAVTGILGGGGAGDTTSSTPSPTTSLLDPVSVAPSSASDPTITPPPATTTTQDGGILGGILNPVTSVAGPVLNPVTSVVLNPVTSVASQVLDPVTSVASQVLDPVTSVASQVLDPVTSVASQVLDPVTSVASQVIEPVTSVASQVIDPVTSIVSQVGDPVTSILAPVSSVVSQVGDPVTSILNPVTSIVSSVVQPITSVIVPPVSSIVQPITSIVGPPISSITSEVIPPITSIVVPPVSSLTSVYIPPVTSVLPPISAPSISGTSPPPTSPTGPSISDSGLPTFSTPVVTSNPTPISSVPDTSGVIVPPTSIPSQSSAGPTISFPTPLTSASITDGTQDSTLSGITVVATSTATFSIDPGLSFVLTESSLAFSSVPTTTPVQTLTDPDQATTTVDAVAQAATTLVDPAALPTGIPARIFPRDNSVSPGPDDTLISILFNNELNWLFVVQTPLASSQIFAYVPVLISTALNITADQVKTYALQVYIPTTYHGPDDASQLGTTWLGYIPSELVDTLAAEIKAKTSAFYTGVPAGVARDLADRVVSGYSLLSVPDPNGGGGAAGSGGSGSTGATGDNGKSRQDAIIGVVSALGAIALLVLVFLVYRSMKRRKQLAHRRLSDPPDEVLGVRPEGREFDQDSVGGARRRSFYYAEDSLRVYEDQRGQFMHDASPTTMSQRRNIVPSTISAPVLRGSTLNW